MNDILGFVLIYAFIVSIPFALWVIVKLLSIFSDMKKNINELFNDKNN